MVQKIVDVKNPKLREKSKPVTSFDKKLKTLIKDLEDTLMAQNDPEGVGLAAPQIGKNFRVFLFDYEKKRKVIINPEIIEIDPVEEKLPKKSRQILEGCLSLPHFYGPIKRSKRVLVKYQDEEGRDQSEEFKGFIAHIIQHEIDHLNGVLFLDRILEQEAPLYKFTKDEWEEVDLI